MDAKEHHTLDDYRRYEALLRDFGRHIEHYCFTHCSSAFEASELVQAVLDKVWNGIATLRPDSSSRQVNRWLQKVMRSAAADWFRRRRGHTVPLEATALVADQPSYDTELLDDLLSYLSDEERVLLQERLDGYSSAEIGERHGIAANAVDQRIFRIVNKLKQIVNSELKL
ncbi:MAG: RNA polymerase sigma factor [Bacteroidales bacterium]|nr:RNA polymerase sigma factor [Bacteroidales bacterium]